MKTLKAILFAPKDSLTIPPAELKETLEHLNRITRGQVEVESSATHARESWVADASTRCAFYLSDGYRIVEVPTNSGSLQALLGQRR